MSVHQLDTVRPTAMGPQKIENEQIFVGHFCGKHAMANRYGTTKIQE